jgi:hypothetical protein
VQIPIPEINVASRSADSAPDKQKYSIDDINNPTPCTLFYIKGKKSMVIEVANAIMVTDHILHGQPIPIECVVVEVIMIREGHEFEDLDYPNKEERIVKLRDTKGTFMLWPRKDVILKTHSSSIVSPQSKEARNTSTSKMSLPALDPPPPPQDQQLELLASHDRGTPSPKDQQPELLASTARKSPSPSQDPLPHPSTHQLGLLASTVGGTLDPVPSTQQHGTSSTVVPAKDSFERGFYVAKQKVESIDKKAFRQLWKALEPFSTEKSSGHS